MLNYIRTDLTYPSKGWEDGSLDKAKLMGVV